ncbi:type VI secretion system protein TssA [Ralstonia sp. UBA689]|uniref:type VI secretion system protein TssA n=1 Tax=Ralstonia sp. UBA689 TaxID=1947373 RepID=UPI0025EA6A20|nr:type VI secretion system protein TssA [Ralstonia sp. UBA689]
MDQSVKASSCIGRQPISETQPCGKDVRDEPEFDLLQMEISRMTNPAATGAPDWQRVVELSTVLLTTTGKDMLVACYLTHGLLRIRGLSGLHDGMQMLADLLQNWWDQLYPPIQRLRARRNALQWLIDQVRAHGEEADWTTLPPQDPAMIDSLCAAIDAVDSFLLQKDDEAVSLLPIRTQVRLVPLVTAVTAPEPAAQASTSVPSSTTPVEAAPAPAPAPASAMPPALKSAPDSGTLSQTPLDSEAPVGRAIDEALERLADVGDWFAEAKPDDPLGFRLRRIAAWAAIEQTPPAQNGQTALPGPIAVLQEALHNLQTLDASADIVNFGETRLRQFPFWLDLNCSVACALERLGDDWSAARREVSNETAKLVSRLPGIEQLKFAGGMPFANTQTLQWLHKLTSSTTDQAAAAPIDPLHSVLRRARALAADNNLAGAADCLQQAIDQDATPLNRLRLRTALCDLLLEQRRGIGLEPFARTIIADIDRFEVCTWAPHDAAEGLRAAWTILSRNDDNKAEADSLLVRIASLNAAIAVRLVTD